MTRAVGETVLKDATELDARRIHRTDQRINAIRGDLKRLFRDDVFAGCGTRFGDFQARPTRHTQTHHVQIVALQHFRVVLIGCCIEFRGEFIGPRKTAYICCTDEIRAVDLYNALRVNGRDIAATNDAKTD